MEVNPLTVIAVVGVASLLIERVFYYRSRYSKKTETIPDPPDPDNPGHVERIATLEKGQETLEKNNEKDHGLIRADIKKLFNLLNGMRK